MGDVLWCSECLTPPPEGRSPCTKGFVGIGMSLGPVKYTMQEAHPGLSGGVLQSVVTHTVSCKDVCVQQCGIMAACQQPETHTHACRPLFTVC